MTTSNSSSSLWRSAFWSLWGMPLVLAILTIFGLLAALLGTGVWHWASWLALATPVAVGTRFALGSPKSR